MSNNVIDFIVEKTGIMRYNSIGQLNNPYYTLTDEHLKKIVSLITDECINICQENGAVHSAENIKNRFQ